MLALHDYGPLPPCADSADADAPILPPALRVKPVAAPIAAVVAIAPTRRITARCNRLRAMLRPAAQTWRRRAARRLHCTVPTTGRTAS